jgi:pyruvate dehydrogenase E2 component (dihydrolipoamide acetyltransferase)
MPFTVTMPKLSPTMEEGTIAKWHKKIGERVKAGEVLLEVATDKATLEHPALDEGILRKILVQEGQSARVNQPIAIFTESAEESIEGYQPPEPPKMASASLSTPFVAKKNVEQAPDPCQEISPMAPPMFFPEPPCKEPPFPCPSEGDSSRIAASPLAKKLAKERGIDLASVKGSGPRGRIVSRDLDLAQSNLPPFLGKRGLPSEPAGSFEEVPLTPMRRVIAERLQQAKSSIPHIYVHQEIDADPLWMAREQLKAGLIKLSINDFIIRAVALALRVHPACNSGFHTLHQTILRFKTIDIAVAVNVEGGLITPIIRYADSKSLDEIATEMRTLAERAKLGKLKPEEYKGGSFTISNMGMYGISDFCAILNPPQAAILAVGSIEERPRVKNGTVVAGRAMSLVLSADHRAIDGAAAAQFLKTVQKFLENPALLYRT